MVLRFRIQFCMAKRGSSLFLTLSVPAKSRYDYCSARNLRAKVQLFSDIRK